MEDSGVTTHGDLATLTQELVRIDSQNPGTNEQACAEYVSRFLENSRIDHDFMPVEEGRPNVVARIPGRNEKPPLVFLAHMDTVPVGSGWSVEPLSAERRDERIYGRGSADMKSGLAAVLTILRDISDRDPPLAGDVWLVATVDEEGPEMRGAVALIEAGILPKSCYVLAPEPTGLNLRIAQMGVMWYRVETFGRMAHAGRAPLGVDANHAMAEIITAVKTAVANLSYEHPILGRPVVTVGRIDGGVKTNVVPASCRGEFDLRIVPPLGCADANELISQTVQQAVRRVDGAHASVENLGLQRPPVEASADSPLILAVQRAFKEVTGREIGIGGADGHEAYTDASIVSVLTQNPHCTVFGPGSTDAAHSVDEYVDVEDIYIAYEVLRRLVDLMVG